MNWHNGQLGIDMLAYSLSRRSEKDLLLWSLTAFLRRYGYEESALWVAGVMY